MEGSQEDIREQVVMLLQKVDSQKKVIHSMQKTTDMHQQPLDLAELRGFLRGLPSLSTETAEVIVKYLFGRKLDSEHARPDHTTGDYQENIERIAQNVIKLEKLRLKDQEIIDIQQHCLYNLQCQVNDLIALNTKLSCQEKHSMSQDIEVKSKNGIAGMMNQKLQVMRKTIDMNIGDLETVNDSIEFEKFDSIDTKGNMNKTVDCQNDKYFLFQDCGQPKTQRFDAKEKKNQGKSASLLEKVLGPMAGLTNRKTNWMSTQKEDRGKGKSKYYVQPKALTPVRAFMPTTPSRDPNLKTENSSKTLNKSQIKHSKSSILHSPIPENDVRDTQTRMSNTKDLEIIGWLREVDKLQRENETLRQSSRQGGQFELYRLRAENIKMKDMLSRLAGCDITELMSKRSSRLNVSVPDESFINSANFSKLPGN